MSTTKQKTIKLSSIKPNPNNPRLIKDDKFFKLVESIKTFGEKMMPLRPIVIDENNIILGGNMRFKALKELGYKEVPAEWIKPAKDLTEEQKKEFIVKDNVGFGNWDFDVLANEWDTDLLEGWGLDMPDWEMEDFEGMEEEQEEGEKEVHNLLSDRFIVPPFSILDTRQGYWTERKRYWKELIGDNGESREGTLAEKKSIMGGINNGVSILDPVLAELSNLWFGINNCKTFDCFAGDSVFGVVSDAVGNSFTGIELRQEQADLNNQRLRGSKSKYFCDDGQNVLKHIPENSQDLLFSCPPYFDLEVYSDLKNDASNQKEYKDFLNILDNAFSGSIKCLKDNRFAVIVISNIRDKKGFYYNLVDDIKNIFIKNNMPLYNDMILLESLGTLPQRAGRWMKNRKVGKCHQNVLVFYKGDPKKIQENFPEIEVNIDTPENLYELTSENLKELIEFRKKYIKEKLIMYLNTAILQEAINKKQIFAIIENDIITSYLWVKNMPRKKTCKIEEICSSKSGEGTLLMKFAEGYSIHDTITLEVVDYNENAINFYLNKGYIKISEKKGKILNYVMQKRLDNEGGNV